MDAAAEAKPFVDVLDEHTCALYLIVPAPQVVLFQAYFEITEAVGLVRTLNLKTSLVSILTTPDTLADCLELLTHIREVISWEFVNSRPAEAQKEYGDALALPS